MTPPQVRGSVTLTCYTGSMAKGRPPTPKHILAARGSRQADNRAELGTAPTSLPRPPSYLKERAAAMFLQVAKWAQDMGTLAVSDTEVIARYAAIWDRFVTAEEELKEIVEPMIEVFDPKNGSYKFSRPCGALALSNSCHEQLRQLETVLGLTPADRTRLGMGAIEKVVDPVDMLLKKAAEMKGR